MASADARTFEVMAGFEQVIEAFAIGFLEQTQPDSLQKAVGNGINLHAAKFVEIRRDV